MSTTGQGPWEMPASTPPRGARRGLWISGAVLVVVGIGIGAFAVAHAVTAPPAPVVRSAAPSTNPGGGLGAPARGSVQAAGTVLSVSSSSFTVKNLDGAVITVEVSPSTTYSGRRAAAPGFGDVTVGASVAVYGTRSSDTVRASAVVVTPRSAGGRLGGAFGGGRPVAIGTVGSVAPTSFVVRDRSGISYTVEVTASTTYRDRATGAASYGDVKSGDTVIVAGTVSGSTIRATSVLVLPAGGGLGGGGFSGGGAL